MTQPNPITVQFHQQTLTAFFHQGQPHVAMKPICENIGLDWFSQMKRIKRCPVLNEGKVIMAVPSAGGVQQVLTLPLHYLNGWLFGIDSSRVKPQLRERVLRYQRECYQVLHDHFSGRAAREHQALLDVLFARHPQWQETVACVQQGLSWAQIAERQGKHPRSVGKMIARIRANGIDCRSRHTMPVSIH